MSSFFSFGFLLKITNLCRDDGDGFRVSLQDDKICVERDNRDGSSQDNKSVQREMMEMAFEFVFKMTNLCRER
jgi:hypothetical protein